MRGVCWYWRYQWGGRAEENGVWWPALLDKIRLGGNVEKTVQFGENLIDSLSLPTIQTYPVASLATLLSSLQSLNYWSPRNPLFLLHIWTFFYLNYKLLLMNILRLFFFCPLHLTLPILLLDPELEHNQPSHSERYEPLSSHLTWNLSSISSIHLTP